MRKIDIRMRRKIGKRRERSRNRRRKGREERMAFPPLTAGSL